jgi:hypothetical protein
MIKIIRNIILIAYKTINIEGKSIYREQGRRIGVRIKTRPPKEGINKIDNKEA